MVHHRDEEVEQDGDVDGRVAAEHEHAPEPGERLEPGQLEVVQVDETKHSPEQRLHGLKQTVE